jgi:hypothetical protein
MIEDFKYTELQLLLQLNIKLYDEYVLIAFLQCKNIL